MNYVILTIAEYHNLKKTNSPMKDVIDYAIFNENDMTHKHWIVYFKKKITHTYLICLFTIN